jgi:electron-transferring-flavoprotein dehydrogenase
VVLGDSAGFVNVPSMKGIHYAMLSGILAAEAIAGAVKASDVSASRLEEYDRSVSSSIIGRDLYRMRNMRQAFGGNLYLGSAKSALIYGMRGWWPFRADTEADNSAERLPIEISYPEPDGELTFTKVDSVGLTSNRTRGDMPSHLTVAENVPSAVARFYEHLCPAGVYEVADDGSLVVNPSNCIDCMMTDVLAGQWSPREGGSGARYRGM